ncbi:hypothetical protein J4Q44_G00025060 [Coregonus suidteri]|uniref:EF-hand domain-containing protein n=2 Tax=Coregonus TaxID=27772 RepID=A0AAN8MHE2_9TELE
MLIFENGLSMHQQMILEEIPQDISRANNLNEFPTKLSFDEAARRLVNYNKATKEKPQQAASLVPESSSCLSTLRYSMSRLEKAVVSMVEVFEEYATKDDKKQQLSGAELAELMRKELASPEFQGKVEPAVLQEAMTNLDKNHDGEINFREFSMFLATLARGYYRARNKGKGNKGKPDKPE